MAKSKRKVSVAQITIPPTPERMAKAEGYIHSSKDGPFTVRDAPLERLHGAKRLTDAQYNAATKFRHHWHNAGLAECFAVQNFMGVGGGSGWDMMPASEYQAHHRDQYRKATQSLGMKLSMVVEDVCCRELDLFSVGKKLNWLNEVQARAAVTELLRLGLDKLADDWGMS
jgi:Domain of unknown function (DUF6456)